MSNKRIVLIVGKPNSGKTTSLRNLPMEEVGYINSDLSDLTFPCEGINEVKVKNVRSMSKYIKACEKKEEVKYVVMDTLTSMMDMFERQVVLTADKSKTMAAWSDYGKFFGDTVHDLKAGTKSTIVLSHLVREYNEAVMEIIDRIPIKGAVGKKGAEHQFSTIVEARLVNIKDLEGFENPWLNITEDEKFYGRKRVFQTMPYKEDGLLTRTPVGMFDRHSVFIDNDAKTLMDIINNYYGEA